MKHFIPKLCAAFLAIGLTSCNSEPARTVSESQQTKIEESQTVPVSTPPPDTTRFVINAPSSAVRKSFPKGMFKSYTQIINYIFAEGSSTDEVRNILGKPELVEEKEVPVENTGIMNSVETWYYGEMIITFVNGIVASLSNHENNKHSLDYYNLRFGDLLESDIEIEKRFALHLLDNKVKAERSL